MNHFWAFTEALQWEQEAYEFGTFEGKKLISEAADKADCQLKAARAWTCATPRKDPPAKRQHKMKAERPKSSGQEAAAATAAANPEVTPTGSQVAEGMEVQTGTPAGVLPDSQSAGSLMTDGPIKEDEVDYEGPKAAESGSEDIDPKHHWDTHWESSESAQ